MNGLPITDDTLAIDLIDRVGPGGHYMQADHTMKHFRMVRYSELFERMVYDQWKEAGSKRFEERLRELTREAMDHQPAPAYRVTDWLSLGAGVVALYGVLDEKVAVNNAEIKIEFTMPQALMLSAYHELDDRWAIMGNLGWQDWSEFGKVGVAVTSEDTSSLTLDRNKDTWNVAFGAQYRVAAPWLLTAGVAYDSSMVDDEDRTPDLPLGEAWRFGLGARYDWSKKLAFGLGYTLLWSGDLDMDVNRGPLAGRVSGTYENTSMSFINFYLNWKF